MVQVPSSRVVVVMFLIGWRMEAGGGWPRIAAHGWFSDNKEWVEFIAAAVVLMLTMTAILCVI